MEDFYIGRSHVPPFGSWDYDDYDLPFTQCFETVKTPQGLVRYSYSREEEEEEEEEEDLYVAGDLYENDVVTPAMIVVPRHPKAKKNTFYGKVKEEKKGEDWVVSECDYEYDSYQLKEAPTPIHSPPSTTKAVDEDLYKISPHLLRPQFNKKKKARGSFFSRCLRPTCVC